MSSLDQARLLFHHVFLPPKVPDKSDETIDTNVFFEHIVKTAETFSKHLEEDQRPGWNTILQSLRYWEDVNDSDGFSQDHAFEAIRKLSKDESLLLHVKAQNAAVIVHREKTRAIFESFEISPKTNAVLKSSNALIRTFPARSVALSHEQMSDRKFVKIVVEYLHKLATESTHMSLESVVKAKADVKEVRQSEHPKLVTQWFFAFLASKGRPHDSAVAVTKRTRDEISWSDTLKPWRRSPTWLCIRVALQLILARTFGSDQGRYIYKIFMLAFISRVANYLLKSLLLSVEDLHIIRIKLARRHAKMAASLRQPLRNMVMQVLCDLRHDMDRTWNDVRSLEKRTIPTISVKQLDLDLLLANSRGTIREVQARHKSNKSFEPREIHIKPSSSIYLNPKILPDASMFLLSGNDEVQTITAFNQWIKQNLEFWTEQVSDVSMCTKLYDLIRRYFESCSTTLNRQPELMSIAILVILEMWIALDKLTLLYCPLLRKFPPEIPNGIFSPLRLPQYAQMVRLCTIEHYLHDRWANSARDNPSVFSDPCAKAFGVQFFETSQNHQLLLAKIEERTAENKSAKLEEYRARKIEYEMKLRKIQLMECAKQAIHRNGDVRLVHDNKCRKCEADREAKRMSVNVFEEPLPSNPMLRKAVVFELQPGEAFTAWRDATYLIVQDLLSGPIAQGSQIRCTLATYYGLRSYYTFADRRVGLASGKKSFSQSHYIRNEISSTVENTLFVPHGLEHKYCDAQKTNSWLAERVSNPSLTKYCRPKLPAGPYSVLLETVQYCNHSQNSVISRQSKCPPSLGTHEFIAYGSMRAGEKLQWINLLRSLIVGDIDLNSASSVVLVEQLVNEVGTASQNQMGVLRVPHQDIQVDQFCKKIQVNIKAILGRVEQNWKEVNTLRCCLIIVSRMMALRNTFDDNIFDEGIFLIRTIRCIALKWASELATRCFTLRCQEDSLLEMKEIQRRVLDAALTAKATWAVEGPPRRLLFGSQTDFQAYVTASILVFDYQKLCVDDKQTTLRWMLLKDQVQAVECAQVMKTLLPHLKLAASQGIRDCWRDLIIDNNWTTYGGGSSYWITSTVVDSKKPVHFNIMKGELLVAGSPVSILPESFTQSLIYEQVFGSRTVDVVASDVPWMEFMTVGLISGNRVYFGRTKGDHTIQCANDGMLYEIVNRNVFRDDLPATIIKKTQPWICLNDGRVEFRQHDSQWQLRRTDWLIQLSKISGQTYSMTRRNEVLIDSTKPYGLTIAKIFDGLETPNNLEICYEEAKGLKVELPRFQLTFNLHNESGRFRCQELAAEIDTNQSIDTFHGMKSRLVLSSMNASNSDPKRLVLIPYGSLEVYLSSCHVQVDIDTENCESVEFFQYKLDSNLCRIDADGDLEAHLFKAYLHAVTSSCLPDRLTGRSGTEESLEALRDSITLTSIPISKRANEILENISRLTPLRKFYPDPNSKSVQMTHWHQSLPSLSQHDEFSEIVTEIGTHSVLANFLFEGDKQIVPEYCGDQELRARALSRTSIYLPFNGIRNPASHDNDYVGRDRDNEQSLDDVYRIASYVNSWSVPTTPLVTDVYAFMEQFGLVSGFGESFNPAGIADLLTIDIKVHLPSLMGFCFEARREEADTTALQLSLIAFGNPKLVSIVNTLIAFAVHNPLKELGAPEDSDYDLSLGSVVDESRIRDALDCCQEISETARQELDAYDEGDIDLIAEFNVELDIQRHAVVKAVKSAWRSGNLHLPSEESLPDFHYLDLYEVIDGMYATWRRNDSLKALCLDYASILEQFCTSFKLTSQWCLEVKNEKYNSEEPPLRYPTLSTIFTHINPQEWRYRCSPSTEYGGPLWSQFQDKTGSKVIDSESVMAQDKLRELLDRMQHSTAVGVSQAADALRSSFRSLKIKSADPATKTVHIQQNFLESEHKSMVEKVKLYLRALEEVLRPTTEADEGFEAAGLWPTPTPRAVLKLLTLEQRQLLPEGSMDVLFDFAQAISAKQRIARLLHFKAVGDEFALQREIDNEAHFTWNIRQYPDWLLLELQNDFLIRPVQVRVAQEIISPSNGVVQLGMGEGKTSVILPMAVTAIADGTRLVRVVVLKSLANEMLRSLARTLSGLINRPVFYLPFSRSTPLTMQMLNTLSVIRQNIKHSGGVLLALPEHLNSFRLMANDRVVANDHNIMQRMLGSQKGFDNSAIDIMDECDEILHPRNELIYTSGSPRPLQGVPERWNVLLDLLELVEKNAGAAASSNPRSIEHVPISADAFPRLRILTNEGHDLIVRLLLCDIRGGALSYLRLNCYDSTLAEAAIHFISNINVDSQTVSTVRQIIRRQEQIECLYLLRGMIAFGHLRSVFEKRWFVNYGLDDSRRCLSAVPYRAKSTPASAAEFAQPDVMMLFTALSYFYAGIQLEDLRHCLALLLKSADPTEEYSRWIGSAPAPSGYGNVTALNVESDLCVEQLYMSFKMNKRVISFFLKRVVFPREAKEYPHKLCSSAWDLCAGGPNRFISAFSGTCEVLLPLTMTKQDIPELRHYDASVLLDLLKERNNQYVYAGIAGGRLDTDQLLDLISRNRRAPSVVIDVGAQILDINKDVAMRWLSRRHDKRACVFFNDNNEKTVVGSNGTEAPWNSSPWKEQVQKCLIFLDEFHTRGTDFQLPDNFTAAVLLGPNLGKDTLVQACMRMRKLAFSQSLVFFAPPEVDQNIRATLHYDTSHKITTSDIIEWCIHQSCAAKEQQRPLWVDRGLAYVQRRNGFDKWVHPGGRVHREQYVRAILEDESHAVSKLYSEPKSHDHPSQMPSYRVDSTDTMTKELLKHWAGCQAVGALLSFGEQEQEREILHEVEQEREVERPDAMNPRKPRINEELYEIILSNRMVYHKPASLRSAFEILEHTSLRHQYYKSQWPAYLLATEDFLYPVKVADGSDMDDFLRPVTWVLALRGMPHLILISCHEANFYIEAIKRSSFATLIPYHPRVHRGSGSFDSLNVYQISAMPDISGIDPKARTALRLYAGQLYFGDFQEYTEFCLLLGLWNGNMNLRRQVLLDATNYVPARIRALTSGWMGKWRANPVELIIKFIGMRRQNEEWAHTHVGRVLNGQILHEWDFL